MLLSDPYALWQLSWQLESGGRVVSEGRCEVHRSGLGAVCRRQRRIIAIPKSVHEERIRQNYEVDDFNLSEEDMTCIAAMDRGRSMILDIPSLDEVYRLHRITFEQ